MKSPICEICLKSGILCSACQEKVSNGELTDKDVELLTLLYKEGEKNKVLSDIEIKKVVNRPDMVLIISSKGNTAKIVGKGGFLVKRLQEIVKKPIRVIEESDDAKQFLQNTLFPTPIISLNVLYASGGEKYKVVIPKNSRLPMPLKSFISLAKEVLKKDVEIAFEGKEEKIETVEDKIKRLVKKMK